MILKADIYFALFTYMLCIGLEGPSTSVRNQKKKKKGQVNIPEIQIN